MIREAVRTSHRRSTQELRPVRPIPFSDKEANWLPAPDGPIYLVMRLYWPKTAPPSILPPGEGLGSRRV
jgi:Protein of unknown function (DUF1214)